MNGMLTGKHVAILVASGFEQSELTEPRDALQASGAETHIVSPKKELVRAWRDHDWGDEFEVDRHIDDSVAEQYDALLIPGGVMSPDFLRMDQRAVRFVADFATSGKLVAAICHGPWLLVEADVVRNRRVTSYPSLRTDLRNALAQWVDEPVVTDANILTSRRPTDLPQFCTALIEGLSGPLGAPRAPEQLPEHAVRH